MLVSGGLGLVRGRLADLAALGMGFTCVARPEVSEGRRRGGGGKGVQQDDVQFRPPSLRDIPDHRARRRRRGAAKHTVGSGSGSTLGSCCGAPPSREGGKPVAIATQDEWEVWDELMRAVDEASSRGGKQVAERTTRHVGAARDHPRVQDQDQEPDQEPEPEKGLFRRLPAIALPSFTSLFAVKKPDDPDTAPRTEDRSEERTSPDRASPDRASPSPRDWANQILRVRATELLDAPDADDGSVVQAVARASTSPVDGASPVLTATVVTPPTTVTIHVDGNDYNSSFLAPPPPPPRPEPSMQRKHASGARATLVHHLAELGHTAAAASDYEGAAATFTRALAADPDDRVGLNEEILAAMQDAQRMARAQEEYDLDKAVEASLRDQQIPTELHGFYRTEDENGLCCSPGTPGSSADSAEGWDWRSLDSSSLGERSVDDISDEDVIVPDSTHDLCSMAHEGNNLQHPSGEEEEAHGAQEAIVLLPQANPLDEESLLPPPRTHASVPGSGCVGKPVPVCATSTTESVLPDPRDAFEIPKMNFSFLTTHEVLDLNEWRNLHNDDTWHEFAGGIRDRRGGTYPDEWFDVVRARKDRLESLRNSQEQGENEGNIICSERRRDAVPRPRLRPGCVPWESPSPGDEDSDSNWVEPQAPRAVRRCAFAIPTEDSLSAVASSSDESKVGADEAETGREDDRRPGDVQTHPAALVTGPSGDDHLQQTGNDEGRVNDREDEEERLSRGALIWHPQPLTVARKVSSA